MLYECSLPGIQPPLSVRNDSTRSLWSNRSTLPATRRYIRYGFPRTHSPGTAVLTETSGSGEREGHVIKTIRSC